MNHEIGNLMKQTMDFGARLEKLCRDRGIAVNELARRIAVSAKTVHEWVGKSGRLPRNPEHIRKLSDFFSVSVEFLLFGKERDYLFLESLFLKDESQPGVYEVTIKKINPKEHEQGGRK